MSTRSPGPPVPVWRQCPDTALWAQSCVVCHRITFRVAIPHTDVFTPLMCQHAVCCVNIQHAVCCVDISTRRVLSLLCRYISTLYAAVSLCRYVTKSCVVGTSIVWMVFKKTFSKLIKASNSVRLELIKCDNWPDADWQVWPGCCINGRVADCRRVTWMLYILACSCSAWSSQCSKPLDYEWFWPICDDHTTPVQWMSAILHTGLSST